LNIDYLPLESFQLHFHLFIVKLILMILIIILIIDISDITLPPLAAEPPASGQRLASQPFH